MVARKTAEKIGGEVQEFFLPKGFTTIALDVIHVLHRRWINARITKIFL